MGMSASQMRYLMISGKKSDIEFQGQQINQQRTTLATESSTLNTNLLSLTVPTPPSSDDFTKVVYTFTTNGTTGTVKSLLYNGTSTDANHQAGFYTLKYGVSVTGAVPQYSHNAIIRQDDNSAYWVYRNGEWEKLGKVSDEQDPDKLSMDKSNIARMTIGTPEVAGIERLKDLDYTNFYKYTVDGRTRYIADTALANAEAGGETIDAPVYYVNEAATYTRTSEIYNCQNAKYSSSGRLESIEDSEGNKFDFTVETEVDNDAYNNAHNEYLYAKQEYEQTLNNINAQLEIIQAQDKKLELKLSDLDTQQQAIQTELDAVKKVIDKNVETTFKTFA